MSYENLNPGIDFYTIDGDLITHEEFHKHDLMRGRVSFSGDEPRPTRELSATELGTVSAWLNFLGHDSERVAEHLDKVIDLFRGYPKGTTIGEIMSGTAKKIVTAVENEPPATRGEERVASA